MKVRQILAARRGPVISIAPDVLVSEAISMLVSKEIGSLVVYDADGELSGIVTERDIMRALAADTTSLEQPVHQVMVREVIIGLPQDDVMAVANTMLEHRVRHMPIVEDGRLIGIVSIGDILKAQRDEYRGAADTLETQMMAEGEES
ncbi:MAG: CBS domain-containing protein [Chloroflexota bacterium]